MNKSEAQKKDCRVRLRLAAYIALKEMVRDDPDRSEKDIASDAVELRHRIWSARRNNSRKAIVTE
jgi:hypothetical protein